MTDSASSPFGRWRSILWPVHHHELGKLFPMLAIFFCITLNYNILRCIKDSLIITAKGSGAEVIPFIKVWAMFPGSLLFTLIYLKLSKWFERETVFYILFSIFLGFFALFGFVFYPMSEQAHLHSFADNLATLLPAGFQGLISMIRYWSFTLFYVMAELWGNIILFVLFWGFANQITKMEEAKRFYGIFGVGVNLSGIFSGELSIILSNIAAKTAATWDSSLTYLLGLVTISGILTILLFAYLNHYIKKHPHTVPANEREMIKKEKPKMSFRESISLVFSSKYTICLMVIVLSYNVIINFVEILWKHEAKELYHDPQPYNIFMNQVTIGIGILATFISLFISSPSLRYLGWTKTALITPFVLLFTSIGFFTFFFLKNNPHLPAILGGIAPLSIVVFFGSLQNCLSRACKYTVFDATKEIAYIPLPHNDKIKAKAAIDGVFNRMGKSTGSFLYQGLLIIFSTITACAPYIALFLIIFLLFWMSAIRSLGKQLAHLSDRKQLVPESSSIA